MSSDIKKLLVRFFKKIKNNTRVVIVLCTILVAFASYKSNACGQHHMELTLQKKPLNTYDQILKKINLSDKMKAHGVPGLSLAVIKNGTLDWAKGFGVLQVDGDKKINTETMFSVGSVSKVGTAVLVLKLAQGGAIDIDMDVNKYLRSWKVEENRYTAVKPVTLRATMSHTAGLTVHGFADFQPSEKLPTTVQILNGESPAKNSKVYVNLPTGSRFRYSGGGTTVQQLLVEEIANEKFHTAASKWLFSPLKMNRSSYENPLPESYRNIAKAHNGKGEAVALPRGYEAMPESAASGLWTTPTDFSKLMIMLMHSYSGTDNRYLSKTMVRDMMTPVSPSAYGLGPKIEQKGSNLLFSHGGSNDSYRAQFIGNLENGNGLIVFTNGTNGHTVIDAIVLAFDDHLNQKS